MGMTVSGDQKCILCDEPTEYLPTSDAYYHCKCKNCGEYYHSDLLYSHEINTDLFKKNRHKLRGYIFEINHIFRNDKLSFLNTLRSKILTTNFYQEIIQNNPLIPDDLDIDSKIIKFLKYIFDNTEYLGQRIKIGNVNKYLSILYARDVAEITFLWDCIERRQLISAGKIFKNSLGEIASFNGDGIILTERGLETIRGHSSASNQLFVAMEFSQEMINLFDDEFKKSILDETNYRLKLVSDEEHNNLIDDQIIAEINRSAGIIADFSSNNRGAYFEAGYAAGINIEVIFICKKESFNNQEKSKKPHFDIEHRNFILWDDKNDLKNKLINRINATLNRKK